MEPLTSKAINMKYSFLNHKCTFKNYFFNGKLINNSYFNLILDTLFSWKCTFVRKKWLSASKISVIKNKLNVAECVQQLVNQRVSAYSY